MKTNAIDGIVIMEQEVTAPETSDYTIHVTRQDQIYFAEVTELCLIAKGASAEEAMQIVSTEKDNLLQRFEEAGRIANLPLPGQTRARQNFKTSLLPFLVKSSIVALVIVVAIFSAQIVITKTVTGLPERATSFVLRSIDELGQRAQWVSDERKKQMGKSLRLLVQNLKPVFDELRPVFEETAATQRPKREPEKSGQ